MKIKKAAQNFGITAAIPLAMYLVMLAVTRANGVTFYGSSEMWRTIFTKLGMSVTMGVAIAMQLRHGRMDFASGATMLFPALMGAHLASAYSLPPIAMLGITIAFSVALSMVTATVYTVSRLPIIICTVALALLYEAFTPIVAGGMGANIISNNTLNVFGRMPVVLFIIAGAMLLYHVVTSYTTVGWRGLLLKQGQQVSVNIGIKEKKNVYLTYVVSGILFGLAAVVYASQNRVETQSNFSTASLFFSNIGSVYIGLFLGKLSSEAIGIFVGALTIQLMNYGLDTMGLGSGGWNNIVFGIFLMGFWVVTANVEKIQAARAYSKKKHA